MIKMKKMRLFNILLMLCIISLLAACDPAARGVDVSENLGPAVGEVILASREDGSGTRGAFTKITGVMVEDEDGNSEDHTYIEAVIQNSTEGIISTVAGDANAIGYISLGSLNQTVKGIAIDGVKPSNRTIQNGTFPIARDFNIAWQEDRLNPVAQDFITYALSTQGQEIAAEQGYVEAISDTKPYSGEGSQSGNISIVGSTSVTPLVEALVEAYTTLNPNVQIDITSNGSSAGMMAVLDGIADIGMASRALKEDEAEKLESLSIAVDGIVVIVNNNNQIESLTLKQVQDIFTGEITEWEAVQ